MLSYACIAFANLDGLNSIVEFLLSLLVWMAALASDCNLGGPSWKKWILFGVIAFGSVPPWDLLSGDGEDLLEGELILNISLRSGYTLGGMFCWIKRGGSSELLTIELFSMDAGGVKNSGDEQ